MLFSQLFIAAFAAIAFAAPYNPWESWRDERSCGEHSYHWDAVHGRCLGAALEGEIKHAEWETWRDERSCREHSFHWDVAHGRCGLKKRDIEFHPDDWRNRHDCEGHSFHWDEAHGKCGLHKREVETVETTESSDERFPPEWRHGDWDRYNGREECERHSFRWDAEHGRCGGLVKRSEGITEAAEERFPPEGRRDGFEHRGEFDHRGDFGRGDWDRWGDRGACEGHSFHWDIEHNRCGL